MKQRLARYKKWVCTASGMELLLVLLMLAFSAIANPDFAPLLLKTIATALLLYAGLVVAFGGIRHIRNKEQLTNIPTKQSK